jgi:hypothetical protein
MGFIKSILSEKGELSTVRLTQIAGLFMAFYLAILGINKGIDPTTLSILCLSFIIPQTIAKVMQKRIEAGK